MSISYAPAGKSGKWDGVMDWLQMLSGASLILFMWCHMILVSSVVISPAIMNGIAHFFEATGMAQVGGPLIFLVFPVKALALPWLLTRMLTVTGCGVSTVGL